jgi:hypothetical protein
METGPTFRVKHRDPYSGAAKFHDPADWDAACVGPSQIDEIEPLDDVAATPYRAAALSHLRVLLAIDEYMSTSSDVRLAWITVAITFDLTSVRGWTEVQIANHLGVSPSTLRCATERFREMAGLASVQKAFIRSRAIK